MADELTVEKLRIHDRLSEVEAELSRMTASVNNLTMIMTGNGDPQNGHIVRMDRLEQAVRLFIGVFSTIGLAGFGLIVWWIQRLFDKVFHA